MKRRTRSGRVADCLINPNVGTQAVCTHTHTPLPCPHEKMMSQQLLSEAIQWFLLVPDSAGSGGRGGCSGGGGTGRGSGRGGRGIVV